MGETELAGQDVVELFLPELNMTLFISKETNLPAGTRVKEFNPMAGQEIEMTTLFSDWTVVDGVAMAYTSESLMGENSVGKVTVSSHTVTRP